MKQIISLVVAILMTAASAVAGGPAVWTINSMADVLKGDARGVSIDETGAISSAPAMTEMFKTGQPYVWSSVVDQAGSVYLGTGSDGRIYRVDRSGKGGLFCDLAELNVSALALGRDGRLFAGTSPDGKVYRIDAEGRAEIYFDPKEKYIWSLAVMSDGSLAVGTGENGRIYRVRNANAEPAASLLFDTSETHIMTLAADRDGSLYAGTDSNGLVLRFGPDGKPFALLDSPLREIHQIFIGPDSNIYVLAVGDAGSSVIPVPKPAPTPSAAAKVVAGKGKGPAAPPEPPARSRYELKGAKTALYRLSPGGGEDLLWTSPTVSGFSILADADGVLVGTSDRGRIYRISRDGSEKLLVQSDADQISTLAAGERGFFATSSNQGNLYRFGPETAAEGTYESTILDANSTAAWGRIWWRSAGSVQVQTRSGNTEEPNETWSQWAAVTGDQSGPIASPKARFLQWRAVLKGAGAILRETNAAYLPRNAAPEVLSITALPTNVGLAANPPIQIDPNIELSGLDPSAFGIVVANVPPRRIYLRSARSFQWSAEDRNGDKLIYDIFYKEIGENNFKQLKEGLADPFFTLDGQTLADGRYVIKVVARDLPDNPPTEALSGERVSEPFDIDNSQPIVTLTGKPTVSGSSVRANFSATDKTGYITRAEFSVNGGNWQEVYADDGISDSQTEGYTVSFNSNELGELTITVRVFDSSGNIGTAKAIVKR